MRYSLQLPCIVLFSFFLLAVTSCSKKSADATVSPNTSSNSATTLIAGDFSISSYSQKTEDKTSVFSSIVFTFSKGGSVTADNKGAITSGTWTYTPSSVGYYGSTPSKSSLTLDMGAAAPFTDLNKTWNIDTGGTDASHLSLTNPEPQDDEHLKFSKQ